MSKGLRITLYIIGGIVVLGAIGNLVENKNGAGQASTLTSPAEPQFTKAQKDSVQRIEAKAIKDNTIKATDLVAFYAENEVKADKELKDKEFYVSGTIGSIGKDIMNKIYVSLKTNDPIRTVQCYIDDENAVAELNKGQKILVKGTCSGLMMNVLMKDCTLIRQ